MQTFEKTTSRRTWFLPVSSFIFFALLFLYFQLRIRPDLMYHGFGTLLVPPPFSTGWLFFKNHLAYPGGILEYASGFISQCFFCGIRIGDGYLETQPSYLGSKVICSQCLVRLKKKGSLSLNDSSSFKVDGHVIKRR